MIGALIYMIKVGLLVAAAVWVAARPGTVRMEWMDYVLTVHVGVFILLALAVIMLAIFLYNIIRTFVDFPRSFRRYREVRRREKGYRAVTLGLSAVAAGDTKAAAQQAQRARKLMPEDKGLPVLLEAQAARLEGREQEAQRNFMELLENKDTVFLGVRGLLQAALDSGQYNKALDLSQHALKIHPRQPWILKIVYDLHVRSRNWDEAYKILVRIEKAKAAPLEKITSDQIAILLLQAEQKQEQGFVQEALKLTRRAYYLDTGFVPSIVRLAQIHIRDGRRRRATKLLEQAWKTQPHPDLVPLWLQLLPSHKAAAPMARLLWVEKLAKENPEHPESALALAQAAMQERLWGEAREHLNKAEEKGADARVYRLLAQLERNSTGNRERAEAWDARAATAQTERCWTCRETGRVYEQWKPLNSSGAFNTIVWDVARDIFKVPELASGYISRNVIEAPKA